MQTALQDMIYILVSQWYAAVEPSLIDLTRPSTILILVSMLGFGALAYAIPRGSIGRKAWSPDGHRRLIFSGPAWPQSCCPCFPSG